MKNHIENKPIYCSRSTKSIKVMIMFMLFSVLFIGTVSAVEWNDRLIYSNDDLKVSWENWWGLGKTIGTAELKSHPSVNYVKKVGLGKQVVMWYDLNFTELYLNGLGNIELTDKRTGEIIDRDYSYVYWGDKERDIYGDGICSLSVNGTKTCETILIGTETYKTWLPYNSREIPKGKIRIGIEVDNKQGDYIDGVWEIVGKKIKKHSLWQSSLETGLLSWWRLNETSGSTIIDALGNDSGIYNGSLPNAFDGVNSPVTNFSQKLDGTDDYGRGFDALVSTNGELGFWANFTEFGFGWMGANLGGQNVGDWDTRFSGSSPQWMISDGSNEKIITSNATINLNEWNYISFQWGSGGMKLFINAEIVASDARTTPPSQTDWYMGATRGQTNGLIMLFDEMYSYDRILTDVERTIIHNEGNGCTYQTCVSPQISITLNSPIDNFNSTSQIIVFNGSVISPNGIVNVSLFIDGILNETNSSGINNTDYNFTKVILDGNYNWTYESCNSFGCRTATTRNFSINTAPIINVFSPTNNSNSSISTIFFNATTSLSADKWIVNYNGTNVTLSDINTTLTVEDGSNFNLLIYANNSDTGVFGLNDTIFFTVDTSSPQVTVTFPNETIDFHEVNTNLSVNWTVSDALLDTCILEYDGINTTVTCLDNQTNINITSITNKSLVFYVNDTLGNVNSSSVSWNYKIFQNSLNYTLTSIGGSTESFTLNITKLSSLQISTVDLVYNLSASSASFTSGDISIITESLGVPNPSANSNFTFYFSFLMSDSSIINTTSNNQTVLNLGIGNCSTFSTLIYNFTLFDEENLTKLVNVTIDYAFNLLDNTRTTKITNFSLSSTANPTQVCISQNLTATSSYSLDAILQYVSSDVAGYLTRFHNILNFSLKNSTIPNNISLYDVVDTTATPFQLTFRDSSLVPKPNILVNVNKQFVSSNDFKTVEIPITDTNGQTILNLVINTGIYNLIFIDIGGNIIASFTKVTAFCDIAIQECTLSLNAPSTIEGTFNLTASTGISYVLSYTNSTSTATLTFNSLNSTAVTVRIIGTTQNQFGNRSVCDSSFTSTLGTVDCDTSSILTTDNYLFIDIFSDGNYVATRVININPQNPLIGGFYGTDGFFIAFLMLLIIIILFSNDKQVLLVMLGIGWAMILIFGLIKGAIIGSVSAGIWLLVSIVTMLWKLRQEETVR